MAINKTINDRFNEVKDYFGLSVNKFAKMIGISQPSAKAIIDGHNEPSNKAIDGLAKGFPMISMEWLLRGIGSMLCGCSADTDTDDSFYHPSQKRTTSEPEAKEERRTSEELLARENELLRQQVQFLKEQVEFYKNKKQ